MSHTYVYTRCSTSTKGQDSKNQLLQIMKKYPVKMWFDDYGFSGSLHWTDRPALQRIFNLAKRGDTVVVYDWTRLSRKLSVGSTFADLMEERGVKLVSITNDYDIQTPNGKLMFGVELSVGENMRLSHIEKVKHGMENARNKGIVIGRPVTESSQNALQMLKNGCTVPDVITATGLSRSMVYKLKKEL
ncbi:recombinase family protein [Enterobacter mori]